jgi:hypothetical protein
MRVVTGVNVTPDDLTCVTSSPGPSAARSEPSWVALFRTRRLGEPLDSILVSTEPGITNTAGRRISGQNQ